MTKATPAPSLVNSFLKGASDASGSVETSVVVGDVVRALNPVLSELQAFKDVWAGIKERDPTRMIAGLIGLIPMLGGAAKAGSTVAKTAGATIASQGFKVGGRRLATQAVAGARATLNSPKTKKQLAVAAEHAGQLALFKLGDYLSGLKAKGDAPQVDGQQHSSFIEARDKIFEALGAKPDRTWNDLIAESQSGGKEVVGRHAMGEKGFRLLAPEPGETGKDNPLRIVWWKDNVDGKTPIFGLEEAPVSQAEAKRILEAYLNRDRSFRVRR